MLKKIVNTILLHETTDKIQIRLSILYTILNFLISIGCTVAKISKAPIRKDLLHYIRDAFIFKNTAIGSSRQQPEPRPQHQTVGVVAGADAHPLGFNKDA